MARDLTRRSFLGMAGASLLASAAAGAAPAAEGGPYNVVLFMSDEHNPKFSSVQGHPLLETPNLERLAREGTLFENCYCPSPLCMPCRSAFMAGHRVHRTQCYSNCNVFRYDYPSYGALLDQNGVHSVYFGKSDVYRPCEELGFSEMLSNHNRQHPGDDNIRRNPVAIREGAAERAKGYGPRDDAWERDAPTVEAALNWLRTRPKTLDRPFTLTLNTVLPHFPHWVTPEAWDRYANGADLPRHGRDEASANHAYALDLRAHFEADRFSDDDIRGLRRGYLGCVAYIDYAIGQVLDTLESEGLADRTVFIYTSDHGEMLGKFGMWWKCSLYEDSARVPLYVRGPGFAAGRRVETPVDLMDVQATLFATTQATRPADWVGEPLHTIPTASLERAVFAEYHGHGTRASGYLIRKGDWKLLYHCAAPHLLFNLREDPEELNDRYAAYPEKARELEAELRAICDPEAENHRAEAMIAKQLDAMRMA